MELNNIHVWPIDLTSPQTNPGALLSADERERAERFRFEIHRQRFIAARSHLRTILSLYTGIPAASLTFAYTKHQKPYLSPAQSDIQFNMTHSENMGLIAVTKHHAIGVDLEKMVDKDVWSIAERFFSPDEASALKPLTQQDLTVAFYRLWTRKEALLKAVGKGLFLPLASFSVATDDRLENIFIENQPWSLVSLPIYPRCQAALATQQPIETVSLWRFFDHEPKLDKTFKW